MVFHIHVHFTHFYLQVMLWRTLSSHGLIFLAGEKWNGPSIAQRLVIQIHVPIVEEKIK